MTNSKLFSLVLFSFAFISIASYSLSAQDCNCTIEEVENNTVVPCDFTIGEIDTVYTTQELRSAISYANNNGGNRTILLADGTYPVASTASYPYITASNIVFRSLSGDRDAVRITGQGMQNVAPGTEIGIFAVGDNITIANLTISDVGNHGITVSGDNLIVYNVKIQDSFEQMLKGVSADGGAELGTVQCSLFEYTDDRGPQWYIGGIDVHDGTGWLVSDNIFKNIASPSQAVAEHAVHFWNSSSDNIIERNHIINCDRGIGFGLGSSPNSGGIIRNNMIYNDGTGPYNDVGIGLETSPGTQVYNNTIHIAYQNAIEYRFAETTDVEISNNLVNRQIRSRNGGQADVVSNITDASVDWYVDALNGDLHLIEAVVEVVDQGIAIPELQYDLDKTPRPQGNGIDIGSHEFAISTSNDEVKDKTKLKIFPNPSASIVQVFFEKAMYTRISVSNMNSQKMFDKSIGNTQDLIEINIQDWPEGLYFCTLIDKDQKAISLKLVKK